VHHIVRAPESTAQTESYKRKHRLPQSRDQVQWQALLADRDGMGSSIDDSDEAKAMRAHMKTDQVRIAVLVWMVGVGLLGSTSSSSAKALYVLPDILQFPGKVSVYDILGPAELALQGEYTPDPHGFAAVGMAIDASTDTLFITYENGRWARVIDGKAMKPVGYAVAEGEERLAGVVYDHDKRRLYCAARLTDRLHVFDFQWDAVTPQTQPVAGSPFKLAGSRSLVLALDEVDDLLYVANASSQVRVYRKSDWSLSRTLTLQHPAVSIAVDAQRQILYTGAGYEGDRNLVQVNLISGQERWVPVDPEAGVIGLAVDDESGFVYVTTGRDNEPGGDDLKVYSPALDLVQHLHLGGSPTGLAIPLTRFGTVPLTLSKYLVSGGREIQGVTYAEPGDLLTYAICAENQVNRYAVTQVVVQDCLPGEFEFVGVEGIGPHEAVYDPTTHAVTYRRAVLEPQAPACFRVVARVKTDAAPGKTLANTVTAQTAETDPAGTTAEITVAYEPLHLTKRLVLDDDDQVDANGVAYVEPGDWLTYEVSVANPNSAHPLPEVILVDTLPEQVLFVPFPDGHQPGVYDPVLHTYTCVFDTLAPSAVVRFRIGVQVKDGLAPGTVILNTVLANGLWTPPVRAEATAAVQYRPLNITKTIVSPAGQEGELTQVAAGGYVTYQICVDNANNDLAAHGVTLTDVLPEEVDFVSAGLGGVYDPVSRVCRWVLPSLAPGQHQCADLVVRLNSQAVLHEPVANAVVAQSSESPLSVSSVLFVPVEGPLPVEAIGLVYSERPCPGCSDLLMAQLALPAQVLLQDVDVI